MESKTQKMLNRMAEEQKNKRRGSGIICPYCEHEQDQEVMYNHVSYWGDDSSAEIECESCSKKFLVEEYVTREFETTTIEWVKKEQARINKLISN